MDREYISTERADLFDVNTMILLSVDVIGYAEDSQILQAFHTVVQSGNINETVLYPASTAQYSMAVVLSLS